MDGVVIPSENVPDELKGPCEQTLKRAKELKKAEPVVAYWCCFATAQRALKVPNRSKEGTIWLMSLLDALENVSDKSPSTSLDSPIMPTGGLTFLSQMKAILAGNEAVSNEAAGAAHVENFALKVFMSADNDDRNGNTGKATIRKFVVAGQFVEVLRCFENGMTEEMEQKLQYARWKAADGAKALREGRAPASGPPMPESEINPFPELPPSSPSNPSNQLNLTPLQRGSFSSVRPTFDGPGSPSQTTPVVSPGLSPPKRPRNNLSNIDTSSHDSLHTPPRNQSFGSGAWSTVATPGLADNDDEEQHFDLGPSAPPLTPPITRSMSADRKNVRFMGPDGAPLSPATTHISVDSYDAPPAPPSSTFGSSPVPAKPIPPPKETRSAGNSSSSLDATRPPSNGDGRSGSHGLAPPSNRGRTNGTNHANRPGGDAASRSNGVAIPHIPPSVAVPPPPPPSLVSYPSHPPPVAQPYGLGLTSPHPQSAPTAPTQKQIDQTQKHAKWAISALDFDDIETARSELRKALAAIGG